MGQFMGIDLGTSALKCLVADEAGQHLAHSRQVLPRLSPQPGYLEQDPEMWWEAARLAIGDCLSQLRDRSIAAVSLSGHMSAPVFLDKNYKALHNAMLIADARAQPEAEELCARHKDEFVASTGNPPINAFAAARILWMARHRPALYEKTAFIVFAKDYVRLRLCGEAATEPTDAGNSLLCDQAAGRWNEPLMKQIGLDPDKFAPCLASAQMCGAVSETAARETGLAKGTPVVRGCADMACSQAGTGAILENVTAITLSTSIQIVEAVRRVEPELVGKMTYHPGAVPGSRYVMSSIFAGGMSIDWLLRLTGGGAITEEHYARAKAETERLYREHAVSGPVFLPFLTGSGSPWFHAADTGVFHGLTPATDAPSLLLSAFEGITFNVKDNLDLLAQHWPSKKLLYLAGGGSRFPVWPRLLTDVLGRPVHLLRQKDASAAGAVMLAGAGVGAFRNLAECFSAMNGVEKTFEPDPGRTAGARQRYAAYRSILDAARGAINLNTNL